MKRSLATISMVICCCSARAETWDMPMAYASSNYHSVVGANFAECVTAGSDGALKIETHQNGSLFSGDEIKDAVQTGVAEIGERLITAHHDEHPLFGIDSIPFLVSSFDEHERLWRLAGPEVAEALSRENLHYLYSVPWPPQGLYFRDEVHSIADMEGFKFRPYSEATARFAELAGMVPVEVDINSIVEAFDEGDIDAMILSSVTGYDRALWAHLDYYYTVDAWLPRNIVFVNGDAWDRLDASTRDIVTNCGLAAKAEGLSAAKEYTQFTLAGLREGGMQVEPPGPLLTQQLLNIGAILAEEWFEEAGAEGRAIVDAYRSADQPG